MAPPLSPIHDWESVGEPTTGSLTYSPAGGTECGTEYEFRVRSYGDAATYAAGWGPDSDASLSNAKRYVPVGGEIARTHRPLRQEV